MPVRPRIQAVREQRIDPIAFLIGDGTRGFTGDAAFPNVEEARRAWPSYRFETWARTSVGGVPAAAEIFDDLTTSGADVMRDCWAAEAYPIDRVLRALEADRAAVRRFQQRDPRGARSIAAFLGEFLARLDRIEEVAREKAAFVGDPYGRGYPNEINWDTRYGDIAPSIH